jgi:hypothetical protein
VSKALMYFWRTEDWKSGILGFKVYCFFVCGLKIGRFLKFYWLFL